LTEAYHGGKIFSLVGMVLPDVADDGTEGQVVRLEVAQFARQTPESANKRL